MEIPFPAHDWARRSSMIPRKGASVNPFDRKDVYKRQIQKAVDASPELRSKKALIETFIWVTVA